MSAALRPRPRALLDNKRHRSARRRVMGAIHAGPACDAPFHFHAKATLSASGVKRRARGVRPFGSQNRFGI
ncbi:hypothetical protein GCM10008171_06650 [Methylopila jiangsuensis]|uniref:Uncharacterized protein n=1 Tax=Methylopila jiangsuensis TaxID=586230 RepID=A0A9W6JFC9_9HYPH|nr:hypothetical protein GCM10008171_06650 [Methylopila jiangsuensis]